MAIDILSLPEYQPANPKRGSGGGVSPLNMVLESMLRNQSQSKADASAAARQEKSIAAQMALQEMVGKQQEAAGERMLDRQLAIEDERALNRRVDTTVSDNERREATYQRAKAAGAAIGKPFEINPDADPAVNEAKANQHIAKATAEVYKQKQKQVEARKKEIAELEEKIQEQPVINTATVNRIAASRPEIAALLSKEELAKLANGTLDLTKLPPSKYLVVQGVESARKELEAKAINEKLLQNEILKGKIREASSRYDSLNEEMRQIGKGVNPWDLYEMPVEGGAPIPDAVSGGLGLRPRAAVAVPSQLGQVSQTAPDDRDPVALPVPQPQMQGVLPEAARFAASNVLPGIAAVAPDVGPVVGMATDALGGMVGEVGDFADNLRRSLIRGPSEAAIGPVSPLVTKAKAAGVGDPLSAYLSLLTGGIDSVATPVRDNLHNLFQLALPYLEPDSTRLPDPLPLPKAILDRIALQRAIENPLGLPDNRGLSVPLR